jgi:hypothetical protein
VRAPSVNFSKQKSQPLADLMGKAAELERKLEDVRASLKFQLAQPANDPDSAPTALLNGPGRGPVTAGHGGAHAGDYARSSQWRTEVLVNEGRGTSHRPAMPRVLKFTIATVAALALVVVLVIKLLSGGASWPDSVAVIQGQAARACQNPDVKSEPSQVNFACAKETRQVLWVFALMTSGGEADFNDTKTGRQGLEPITPTQGGQVAWFLNLHHPYNPMSPIDSLEVGARAINNIVGGATLTGTKGNPQVQPGLESIPANCARYTGSAALLSRKGFPSLCARPVTSAAGQAALAADIYRKWVVGASAKEAQDVEILFKNADNPGDSRVQTILRHLPN